MSMNYNPYAAPNVDPRAMTGGPGALGGPQPWEVGEVIGHAWEAVKRDWPVIIFAPIVAAIIQQIPTGFYTVLTAIGALEPGSGPAVILNLLCSILGWLIGSFFLVGQLRIFMAASRAQSPEFGMLFGGADRFLPLLGAQLLVGLVVLVGIFLLFVPGIIAALGLCLAQYYVVDANMGPMEAMRASWESTKGYKGNIFLLGLASIGVMLLGFLAFCIGVFPAVAVVWVAMATVYIRLSGRGGAPTLAGPPVPPQGGFGPPQQGGFGGPQQGGFGGPPQQGGGFGPPPQGGGFGPPQQGGGFGPPPAGWGPPQGGGWGG